MKGLITKDLYFLGNSLKMLIVAMVVIGIGTSFLINTEMFIIIFPIALGSVILITIPKEKNTKWDKFIALTPLPKDTLLNTKYLLYLAMVFIGIVIGIVITFISYYIKGGFDLSDLLASIGLSISVSLLSGGISIPINFLWSEERAIIGQISSYTFVALFLVALLYGINFFVSVKDNIGIIMIILGIVSMVIFIISWIIGKNKVIKLEYN
ncbi:TPA: ABC-2 transporter permease [Streptococcus agalactiae]|uniref:ABC-2 transporter permease n=1 Tax=Ezakiella peruensis TaxID=1464038 RepID=UPI000C1B40F1|nr:ABC-2 transporter permease [Ezakiella peruensis]